MVIAGVLAVTTVATVHRCGQSGNAALKCSSRRASRLPLIFCPFVKTGHLPGHYPQLVGRR